MKGRTGIKYIFVDIGGVLLIDELNHGSRKLASFGLEAAV